MAAELGALAYEAALYGPLPGAVVTNAIGAALVGVDPALLEALFAVHWWAHVALVATFLVWLPTTKHLHVVTSFFNVYLRKLEPRGALPAMDLEAEDATYGLRTLADLAWKDVLDGFTCTECGRCQDACPAHVTGKPLDPKALVMGIRAPRRRGGAGAARRPELARRSRPRRGARRRPGAGRRRDPAGPRRHLRGGRLGLRDLRRLRGGLPGAHRARRQDRRDPAQPRPRGEPLPGRADAGLPGDGVGAEPVGPAPQRPPRLDEGAAVRGAGRGRRGAGRPARRRRGPLLGRLRRRLRRAQPARRPGLRHLPRTPRASASPCWARRRPARATRRGGWATSTSSSSWRRQNVETLRRVRAAADRDGLPALLQHDRQRVPAAGRHVRGRSTTRRSSRASSPRVAWRRSSGPTGPRRGGSPSTTPATSPATTA